MNTATFSDQFYIHQSDYFDLQIKNKTFVLNSKQDKNLNIQIDVYEKLKNLFENLKNLNSKKSKKMIIELKLKSLEECTHLIANLFKINSHLKENNQPTLFIANSELSQIMEPIKYQVFSQELTGFNHVNFSPFASTNFLLFKEFIFKYSLTFNISQLNSLYRSLLFSNLENLHSYFSSMVIRTILSLLKKNGDFLELYLHYLALHHPSITVKQEIIKKIQEIEKKSTTSNNLNKNYIAEIALQLNQEQALEAIKKVKPEDQDYKYEEFLCRYPLSNFDEFSEFMVVLNM